MAGNLTAVNGDKIVSRLSEGQIMLQSNFYFLLGFARSQRKYVRRCSSLYDAQGTRMWIHLCLLSGPYIPLCWPQTCQAHVGRHS